MNIILQNYKNLIEKIIKDSIISNVNSALSNFNGYNINNYIELLSSFDKALCDSFKISFIALISELDNAYRNTKERKNKFHIKGYYQRTIMTIFGEITIKRCFYKSKLDGSSFCYVDRLLGLQKYDYFDPYIKAEILDYAANHNYSETAEHINILIGNRISLDEKQKYLTRQTIRNVILKSVLSEPEIERLPDVNTLYLIADEKWIPTQNNNKNKVMQKSIVIFDGFNKKGKRKSLNNKMTFSGRNENFIYEAINYIDKAYDTSKIKKLFMLGDGAMWINNLKYEFNCWDNIKVTQALDHFHLKQALWNILNDNDVYKTLVSYILNNKKKEFDRLTTEIIDVNSLRKENISHLKKYILNNWRKAINLFKYNLSCPMESQISHTFAAYFTSRPKAYSKSMIDILINLRLKKKNRYNIKKLYLNNLDSKEIKTINKKEIDYSIFDKTDTYKVYGKMAQFKVY